MLEPIACGCSATFSGAYLGIGQHLVYNVAFTRILGSGTDLLTGLKKVRRISGHFAAFLYHFSSHNTCFWGCLGLKRAAIKWM